MSEPNPTVIENTGLPKKEVSRTRNVVGLVVLLIVVVVGTFQYLAMFKFNAARRALETRTNDEERELVKAAEADELLGRSPDGPGSQSEEGGRKVTIKTYTWHGPLRSFTLTATYLTGGNEPILYHFETEGAKFVPEASIEPLRGPAPSGPPPVAKKGGRGKKGGVAGAGKTMLPFPATKKAGDATAEPTKDGAAPTKDAASPTKAAPATSSTKAAEPSPKASKDAAAAPDAAKEPK